MGTEVLSIRSFVSHSMSQSSYLLFICEIILYSSLSLQKTVPILFVYLSTQPQVSQTHFVPTFATTKKVMLMWYSPHTERSIPIPVVENNSTHWSPFFICKTSILSSYSHFFVRILKIYLDFEIWIFPINFKIFNSFAQMELFFVSDYNTKFISCILSDWYISPSNRANRFGVIPHKNCIFVEEIFTSLIKF